MYCVIANDEHFYLQEPLSSIKVMNFGTNADGVFGGPAAAADDDDDDDDNDNDDDDNDDDDDDDDDDEHFPCFYMHI